MMHCARCSRSVRESESDDCVRCQSKDLCEGCLLTHDCDEAAEVHNRLTIAHDVKRLSSGRRR